MRGSLVSSFEVLAASSVVVARRLAVDSGLAVLLATTVVAEGCCCLRFADPVWSAATGLAFDETRFMKLEFKSRNEFETRWQKYPPERHF